MRSKRNLHKNTLKGDMAIRASSKSCSQKCQTITFITNSSDILQGKIKYCALYHPKGKKGEKNLVWDYLVTCGICQEWFTCDTNLHDHNGHYAVHKDTILQMMIHWCSFHWGSSTLSENNRECIVYPRMLVRQTYDACKKMGQSLFVDSCYNKSGVCFQQDWLRMCRSSAS